jgi:hypothetical protein
MTDGPLRRLFWRVANLMLTRYGDAVTAERANRANELAANGDLAGVAV